MPDDSNAKKIMALRTFADDVKRAREKNPVVVPEEPEVKTPEEIEAEPVPVVEEPIIMTEPEPTPPPPLHKKQKPKHVVEEELEIDEGPVEIPPFHFIRASSPDDTTYDDEHDIPDKKTLKKETVRKTAPPKHDPVPTHTINVDTDGIQEPQQSIHSNRDGIFDTEEASLGMGEGSIVTDKKRIRFNLFKAIGTAMRKWFGTKKDAIAEARKPKHIVEKSDRRKEVIQAASRQTKQVPSDDHLQVSDRLKDVERITVTDGLSIRDASEVAKPKWGSGNGEDEQDEAIKSRETTVSSEKITETEEIAPTPTNEETKPPTTPVPSQTKNGGGYSEFRDKYGEEFSPKEDTFEESLPPSSEVDSSEQTPKPTLNRTPVPDYRLNREGKPVKRQDGTPFLTLIAVVITAIILGVGTTVWWFTRGTDVPTTFDTTQSSDLVTTEFSNAVPLSSDKLTFYSTLQETIRLSSGGVTQFYPSTDGSPSQISSVFNTLRLHAPGSFTRAVTDISFGSYESSEPFIVMKTTSFDTAFGGMLTWEQNMSSDLAPLFGPETVTTAIDSRINNKDIRVLVSVGNEDKIVYGFIDKNTVLITTNRQAYSSIAPLVK